MKGRVIVLDWLGAQEAAALMVDGQLEDLALAAPQAAPPLPGAIFRALPDRPMKGQGGTMVSLPGGRGFLRGAKPPPPGRPLLVQVSGVAEPGKAVPVTDRILFKSRTAIVTPGAPGLNVARSIKDDEVRVRLRHLAEAAMEDAGDTLGLIVRSAAAAADEEEIAEDIAEMRALAETLLAETSGPPELLLDAPAPHALAWREWGDPAPDAVATEPGGFEHHGVLDALEALRSPREALPGGASMFVEPTRALVAVDINTGGDTSPAAGLKANTAALRALPRALRLRGLGGQITIDPAPMPKKDRKGLEQTLRAALRTDPVETAFVGWTPLGLLELQRKRDRLPLTELLAQ